jgi:hypothetical protein
VTSRPAAGSTYATSRDRCVAHTGFDPRALPPYRAASSLGTTLNEMSDRELMRDGRWVV